MGQVPQVEQRTVVGRSPGQNRLVVNRADALRRIGRKRPRRLVPECSVNARVRSPDVGCRIRKKEGLSVVKSRPDERDDDHDECRGRRPSRGMFRIDGLW